MVISATKTPECDITHLLWTSVYHFDLHCALNAEAPPTPLPLNSASIDCSLTLVAMDIIAEIYACLIQSRATQPDGHIASVEGEKVEVSSRQAGEVALTDTFTEPNLAQTSLSRENNSTRTGKKHKSARAKNILERDKIAHKSAKKIIKVHHTTTKVWPKFSDQALPPSLGDGEIVAL